MKRFPILAAILALGLPILPLMAQQPPATTQPYEEKLDVNVVLLDVIVTDSKGNQILGLGKDDFVVRENGATQPIDSVDYYTNRQLLDEREANAPFKVEQVREDRYFVFFFDKPENGALFGEMSSARLAARDFIEHEMKENDRVAIVGHDVRLKVYSDFTSDKKQLVRALDETARFGQGITTAATASQPSILANIHGNDLKNNTGTVYEAIDVLADSLKSIRARKNLVLFSPGIADLDEEVRNDVIVNRSRHLDPMLQSLNAANVSVYAVQLQRNAGTAPLIHQRLAEISQSTGGRYFEFNTSFRPALKTIEKVNNGYYLLTYRAHHDRGNGGFQKVNVSVTHPELRVTARSGYQYGG